MQNIVPPPNVGGRNQTTPGTGGVGSSVPTITSGTIPGSPGSVATNPYVPNQWAVPKTEAGSTPTPIAAPGVPNVGGLDPSTGNTFGSVGGLDKQLKDIWGSGVGGALGKLLEGMSGTDSQVLQDFIKSLQPSFAQQSANLDARLGAGGVSSNSSVAAIAHSNLGAQENALIADESAKLTMSQEQLTASILERMMDPAQKEVATSGWSIFGDVMNQITGDIGNLMGGSYKTSGNTPGPEMSPSQLNFGGVDTSMDAGISESMSGSMLSNVSSIFPV